MKMITEVIKSLRLEDEKLWATVNMYKTKGESYPRERTRGLSTNILPSTETSKPQ